MKWWHSSLFLTLLFFLIFGSTNQLVSCYRFEKGDTTASLKINLAQIDDLMYGPGLAEELMQELDLNLMLSNSSFSDSLFICKGEGLTLRYLHALLRAKGASTKFEKRHAVQWPPFFVWIPALFHSTLPRDMLERVYRRTDAILQQKIATTPHVVYLKNVQLIIPVARRDAIEQLSRGRLLPVTLTVMGPHGEEEQVTAYTGEFPVVNMSVYKQPLPTQEGSTNPSSPSLKYFEIEASLHNPLHFEVHASLSHLPTTTARITEGELEYSVDIPCDTQECKQERQEISIWKYSL